MALLNSAFIEARKNIGCQVENTFRRIEALRKLDFPVGNRN